jgi:hypothetical protein
MAPVVEVYRARHTDLWRHNPDSFVRAVEQYHVVEAAPVLKALILEPAWEMYVRHEAISVLDSIAPDVDFLREVVSKFKYSADVGERKLSHIANGLLVTAHADADAIRWRLQEIVRRVGAFIRPRGGGVHGVGDLEDEITFGKTFAKPLMDLKHPGYEEDYLKLLDEAMGVWAKGKEYHEYTGYMWEIVYNYFDNLKEKRSYAPLRLMEERIATMKDREGANWLAGRMTHLRRSYLTYLGKPDNISIAIAKYNDVRSYDVNKIQNSGDLFRHVQDAFDTDLRRWIEDEGAYAVLGHKISGSGKQEYEKLIQKTLKSQIENILIKRGFHVEVLREAQLLDDKRTDLIIRYGFVGPIIVEVKLTSNTDIQGTKIDQSKSYASMAQYMQGYGASHGIFMVVDNVGAKNLPQVTEAFQKITGVSVLSFSCQKKGATKKIAKY